MRGHRNGLKRGGGGKKEKKRGRARGLNGGDERRDWSQTVFCKNQEGIKLRQIIQSGIYLDVWERQDESGGGGGGVKVEGNAFRELQEVKRPSRVSGRSKQTLSLLSPLPSLLLFYLFLSSRRRMLCLPLCSLVSCRPLLHDDTAVL